MVEDGEVVRAVHTSTGSLGRTPVGDFKVYAKVALLLVGPVPRVDAVGGVLPRRDRDPSVARRPVVPGVARMRPAAGGRGRCASTDFVDVGTPVSVR